MESKFKALLSKLVPVQTGTKASNDVTPTLTVLGIPNKFNINKLAANLLKVRVGDRLRIFQLDPTADYNERYFIAKVADEDDTAAKLSASNSATKAEVGIDMAFNYSGVWSSLVQNEVGATELGYDAMVEKGCVIKGETSGGKVRYRSSNEIKMEVEAVGDGEIDGVMYENVCVLTNYRCVAKSPEDLEKEIKGTTKPLEVEIGDVEQQEAADDLFKEEAEE